MRRRFELFPWDQAAQIDTDAIYAIKPLLPDDLTYAQGPMISHAMLREHISPWYRQVAARCHQTGRLYFLHPDGALTTLTDDLIDLRWGALHPIDPTVMEIEEVRRRWGHRLCLFGNVDLELLRVGSAEAVRARVRDLLSLVAPRGRLRPRVGKLGPGLRAAGQLQGHARNRHRRRVVLTGPGRNLGSCLGQNRLPPPSLPCAS